MAFDLGIDMGSSHTRIYLKKHGLVVDEPSLVIVNNNGQAIAIGDDASEMIGRTPDGVDVIRPIRNGVITSFQATVAMLRHFIKKAAGNPFLKARVVIGVPSGITEVERRAVEEAVKNAGAKDVYMIEEPLAAALGCGVDLTKPKGTMIVDVGAGVTEVAVVSLGGIVVSQSVRIAGETFDNDIVQYVKKNFNMVVGDVTAENLKITVGAAVPFKNCDVGEMKGRDSVTGLPKTIALTSNEISEALCDSVGSIVDVIKSTLEKTPPELAADILETGIILTGGGARLRGLGKLIQVKTEIPVFIAEEAMDCAAIGAGKSLENMNSLKYHRHLMYFEDNKKVKNSEKTFEHKIILFLIIATIGLAVFIGVHSVKRTKAAPIENGVSAVVTPVQKGASGFANWFSGIFKGDLETENERLKKEKQELERKINEMQGLEDENEELRDMLDLKKTENDFTLEAARVVAKDPSNWYGTFTIDKGTSSRLSVNQPVISADRELIGKVYRVGTNWAEIITVFDSENSVGSVIKRSKAMGVIEGDANLRRSGTCRMNYIARDADVREGDFIESSGLGGIYPAGILIGKVVSVGEDASNMSKYAVVQPSADIEKVGEVFVVTNSEVFVAKDGEKAKRSPSQRGDKDDDKDNIDEDGDENSGDEDGDDEDGDENSGDDEESSDYEEDDDEQTSRSSRDEE